MPMYNLLEYSKNYRTTTESLWNNYNVFLTIIGGGDNPLPNLDYDANKKGKKTKLKLLFR